MSQTEETAVLIAILACVLLVGIPICLVYAILVAPCIAFTELRDCIQDDPYFLDCRVDDREPLFNRITAL